MIRVLVAALLGTTLLGCAEPTLVAEMKARGASYLETGKIVVVGSEAGFGPIAVEIVEEFLIQEIWDSIYASRPYDVRYLSGDRRAEFYRHQDDAEPTLVLAVNASGAANIAEPDWRSGTYPRGYRCPGLNETLVKLLEVEYRQRQERE